MGIYDLDKTPRPRRQQASSDDAEVDSDHPSAAMAEWAAREDLTYPDALHNTMPPPTPEEKVLPALPLTDDSSTPHERPPRGSVIVQAPLRGIRQKRGFRQP
jgi:hypothetical protein